MSGRPQDGEGFLSRWSRRKRERVHPEDEAVETDMAVSEVPQDVASPEVESASEDPELVANREAAEAVDLESLTYESDFTVFMKRGVPDALKNAALRKLWRSNPDLAVLDGLNDYDTDFRTAETAVDGFKSAWKVGRGYADKAEEVKAEMEARSARAAEELQAAGGEDPQEIAQGDAGLDAETPAEAGDIEDARSEADIANQGNDAAADPDASVGRAPRRRRMAFDVGE